MSFIIGYVLGVLTIPVLFFVLDTHVDDGSGWAPGQIIPLKSSEIDEFLRAGPHQRTGGYNGE